ncbi:MAG: C2H2-type zinc finger protein [Bacilli bacterium]
MIIDVYNKTFEKVIRSGIEITPKSHRRIENPTRSQYKELKACSLLVIKVSKEGPDDREITQQSEGFTCPYCPATFMKKTRLNRHIEIAHGKGDDLDE